jgi:hypothetical protein
MATTNEIQQLRRMTGLEEDDEVYTDSLLGGYIDDLGMTAAYKQVWTEKAAAVAALVDTTESGSSRSLSQLRKSYLEMAGSNDEEVVTTASRSYTVEIQRV